MLTELLAYAFFAAGVVMAIFALLSAFRGANRSWVRGSQAFALNLVLALLLVGFGQLLRLLLAILQAQN